MSIPRLVVAAVTSGAGKTTLAAGLIAALRARALRVQPFKCGPDYLDPSYHSAAAGQPCRTLDTWLLPEETLRGLFRRACRDAEVAIVEGVMGLYDGRANGDLGSTAHIARLLDAPVLLVLDVAKASRTLAAVVVGLARFDPRVRLAGVVLNNVASERHRQWVAEAVEAEAQVPVLGALPRQPDLALPERHLGLQPSWEHAELPTLLERLAAQVAAHVDLERVLALARSAGPLTGAARDPLAEAEAGRSVVLAVARDAAFNFYYQDSLDLLAAHGAVLAPFRPTTDAALPEGTAGVYVGGGYPELHAEALAANAPLLDELRARLAAGMPLYAECGGLMYACQGIVDFEGRRHRMLGVMPGWSIMRQRRTQLGYVEVEALRDTLLHRAGERARGHEFHWSELEGAPEPPAYHITGREPPHEGWAVGGVLASYVHLHFAGFPPAAARFVAACRAWQAEQISE
ncbi:MAG: cobyrinate a,c-diamide synthase [Chloroflexi bacterium]|nr:cobyrinate a,c-diamide synthase [Chloroflexota bacterium]